MLASIGGTFYFQNAQIHKYHQQAEADESIIAIRDQRIKDLTDAQNEQFGKSEQAVIKVVQGPKEVQSIIERINSAPITTDCKVPQDSDEVKNAF